MNAAGRICSSFRATNFAPAAITAEEAIGGRNMKLRNSVNRRTQGESATQAVIDAKQFSQVWTSLGGVAKATGKYIASCAATLTCR